MAKTDAMKKDSMSKDGMAKTDAMKKDSMSKDGMAKTDAMKKDSMSKDGMAKTDTMKKDSMSKDGMAKTDTMKKDNMKKTLRKTHVEAPELARHSPGRLSSIARPGPSFFRRRATRDFFSIEIRIHIPGALKRIMHTINAWRVALANGLFGRHHAIFSVHIAAAGPVKRLATIHDCNKLLRHAPHRLTHLRARLRREAIVRRRNKE